jgi:hypothetical protein
MLGRRATRAVIGLIDAENPKAKLKTGLDIAHLVRGLTVVLSRLLVSSHL